MFRFHEHQFFFFSWVKHTTLFCLTLWKNLWDTCSKNVNRTQILAKTSQKIFVLYQNLSWKTYIKITCQVLRLSSCYSYMHQLHSMTFENHRQLKMIIFFLVGKNVLWAHCLYMTIDKKIRKKHKLRKKNNLENEGNFSIVSIQKSTQWFTFPKYT